MATSNQERVQEFAPLENDLLLRAARGERTERVPVWVMRQAGRYLPEYKEAKGDKAFFATCRDVELVSRLTIQPIDRFALDGAIIFSDILVIPLALGLTALNDPGQGPVFADPIKKPEDVDRLNPNFDIIKELGYVYESITLTRQKLKGRVPLFGFTGAPWTLMKYMIENLGAGPNPNAARRFLIEYPAAGEKLLKILTDAIVRHLVEQVRAGAQIVQVFDSSGGELGPGLFTKYELPRLQDIAYKVKQEVKQQGLELIPMVVFAKDAHYATEQLATIGFDVVQIDWTQNPTHARRLAGTKVTLQGNLDPVMVFGTDDEIRHNVKEMIQKFGTQRYIANLGHGVMKETNPDKLKVFIDAVHTYSEEINALS
ncbi:uroporphyrinogen decarboxylase-like [Haliotis cracherodii]|uniref:uroporphyrinogen decarboxylase-like n=1 Tax=Haliotis cracherodii TaxID=6455 RepID=UPI0039EC2D3C